MARGKAVVPFPLCCAAPFDCWLYEGKCQSSGPKICAHQHFFKEGRWPHTLGGFWAADHPVEDGSMGDSAEKGLYILNSGLTVSHGWTMMSGTCLS